MTSFTTYLENAVLWTRDHLLLAIVPLLSTLLGQDNIRRVLSEDGFHIGAAFRFPSAILDLWTFVSVPSPAEGFHVSPLLLLLPVFVLLKGTVAAGYLGSIHQSLSGDQYDFTENVFRYGTRLVAFEALVTVVTLATASLVVIGPAALFILLPAYLVLGYLFYGTPYLVVIEGRSVADALAESYRRALRGGSYFSFGIGHLLAVTAVSIPATLFAVNLGLFGVLIGAMGLAPVALTFNAATVQFFTDVHHDGIPRTIKTST